MKKIILLFLFISLLASNVIAAIDKFFTINAKGRIVSDEPEFIKEILDTTEKIDSYKISKVNISVVIMPENDNASFDSGRIVEIPRTMVIYNHFRTNPSYKTTGDSLAVYAHEYGHAVFDVHISRLIPEYAKIKKIMREISMLSLRPLTENMTQEQVESNNAKIKKLRENLKSDKEALRLIKLTLPYHELFADTIAVFAFNSKNAIHKALYYNDYGSMRYAGSFGPSGIGFPIDAYNPHDPNKNIIGRDFNVFYDVDSWTNGTEHTLFGPLRSVIGSDECWPNTESERADKLKVLLKILLSDMVEKNASKKFPEVADNKKLMESYIASCK